MKCGGNETALRNCESYPWGHYSLSHDREAGVICAGQVKPRLVNGNSPCAGRLEIYDNLTWRTICSDDSWALTAANVVCQELGCGSGAVPPPDAHFGEGAGPVIGPPGCGHQRDLGVICSGTIAPRLVNGNSACDGRLEIYANGSWRTVCGLGSWHLSSLDFTCKALNCGSAMEAQINAQFGEGSGPVIGPPGCSHQQDIGVICSESRDLRLVSVDSRCSGRLEIRQRQQWGTVCDRYFDWEDAAVVCAHLKCGTVAGIQGRAH
ncbi:deleted in malignant brain tumors 1 protein-like, partial [Pristis pectinata]|uniref:deleted in malignant brain tumors 1 protein-like n=1 Tax=Pristis pectinata TaxID=685728 RepID=UPI00223E2D46